MALNALDTADEILGGGTNSVGCLRIPRGLDLYYPKGEGDVTFIVVPYVTTICPRKDVAPGDLYYCRPYFRYRGLGADKKGFCLDNKSTFGERCAITESLASWGGDPKAKPKSQKMCLLNVYFPATDEMKLMDFSFANFMEKFMEEMKIKAARPKKDWVQYFADPVEGSEITFNWKQDSMPNGNKFFYASGIDFERHNGEVTKPDGTTVSVADLVKRAANLDECLNRLTFAEVASMFLGEDQEDSETEDTPPPAVNKPVAKDPEPEVEDQPEPPKAKKPAPKVEELVAEEPEAPTRPAVPKKPAPKSKASSWSKGSQCYFDGKECVVKKVDGDVITIAEVADDDERYKVSADDLSPFAADKPVKAAKETVKAEPSKEADAFDADWDD